MPTVFAIAFKYFWFAGVAIAAINAIMFRRRALAGVEPGSPAAADVAMLARGYFFWIGAPAFLLGVIQLLGGHRHALFLFSRDAGKPSVLAGWGVSAVVWGVALWWVWRGRGATVIAEHAQAFNAPSAPNLIRVLMTLCVAGGVAGLAAGVALDFSDRLDTTLDGMGTPPSAAALAEP